VGHYRSTQPILDAANAVMAHASEGFAKTLTSSKPSAELPYLITVEDETAQAVFIAGQALEQREAGIELQHQAVLFRAAHHSGRKGRRLITVELEIGDEPIGIG
jgi:DNA helicase-2/ATP-dependent DNA helicase PcrA